jgi:2-polyprenyl-6-methoxyphenol hydroxylase-like FAD-dependent oxidoreductase
MEDDLSVNDRRVLISGASVAGPVLAYWLNRFGFQSTVVERTAELRFGSGGHAVDLFDPALQIIDWMGALTQVQDAGTHTEIFSFIRGGHAPSRWRRVWI